MPYAEQEELREELQLEPRRGLTLTVIASLIEPEEVHVRSYHCALRVESTMRPVQSRVQKEPFLFQESVQG